MNSVSIFNTQQLQLYVENIDTVSALGGVIAKY